MSPTLSRLYCLLVGLVLAAACFAPPAAANDDPHVLVLGRISDDPKAHYEQLKPLLDYVVPRMADVGIREGRILMARDAQQMRSYLRRGRVDWVTETAASGVQMQLRAGAQPLLLTERNGVRYYHTVFIARRDRGLRTLDDMRGHSIAFQNASSTSSYFVPAEALLARGMPLEILLSPEDRPADGSVGYLFARSELNVSTWVHKGLVDAGALSNVDWDSAQRVPASYRRDLVVFHETEAVPRALEVVRGDLDARIRDRLREVLLQAADDPDARVALMRFFQTTRFLPIDATGEASLARLRAAVARVTSEVE